MRHQNAPRYLQGQLVDQTTERLQRFAEALTSYERIRVEAFGRQWMSTREAAARLEVEPRGLWRLIEAYPIEPGLGRGFYLRSDLERIVTTLTSEQRALVERWPALQARGLGGGLAKASMSEQRLRPG